MAVAIFSHDKIEVTYTASIGHYIDNGMRAVCKGDSVTFTIPNETAALWIAEFLSYQGYAENIEVYKTERRPVRERIK